MLNLLDISLEITNGTNALGEKTFTNIESIILQILTVIAAFAAVYVAYRAMKKSNEQTQESNRLTRESNELLRLDIMERLRPKLEFQNCELKPKTVNGKQIWELFPLLKNFGSVPVYNVTVYPYVVSGSVSLEELVKNEDKIKDSPNKSVDKSGTLFPNDNFIIPMELTKLDQKLQSIILWVEYEFLNGIKEELIYDLGYRDGHYYANNTHSNYNIKKEREKWKH